jgi:hypothetical protein
VFLAWGAHATVWHSAPEDPKQLYGGREGGREGLWRLGECVRRGGRIPLTNVVQLRFGKRLKTELG